MAEVAAQRPERDLGERARQLDARDAGAGELAVSLGIQTVFLWVLVILMIVNALVLGVLYRTYPRDVRRVETELERRRTAALARGPVGGGVRSIL